MAVTSEIIKGLRERLDWPKAKTEETMARLIDVVGHTLSDAGQVKLENFGIFKLLRLPARQVVTEVDGEKKVARLPAAVIPDFQADEKLKNEIASPSVRPEGSGRAEKRAGKSDVRLAELVGRTIPKEILSLIPEPIARKYQAVPFALKEKTLLVAMVDPENEEAFSALRKVSRKIIEPYIASQDDISFVLDQYSALQGELKDLLANAETDEEDIRAVEEKEKLVDEDQVNESSPAAKVVSTLLKRAVREKASDIHIEPFEDETHVRFRIDGVLRKVLTLPKEVQPAVASRIKILSNLKIDETRLPQDGRIQIMLDGRRIDFRISCLPTVNGEKIVARVLDHSAGAISLDQLGVQGRAFELLDDNVKKAHGMILVTGPTGSGKSTTLYAMVARVKKDDINIVTMEDPVEYRMGGVNQSQVNASIGYTFAAGLRSILRQDPNVIMVGEIRDKETADIAINSALTGHIVISTLHTNDAAGAIPRLIDMGIEPFLITSSMNAIVAQRLCRKICEKCRQEAAIKTEENEAIRQAIETMPEPEKSEASKQRVFYHGAGCTACGNSGYRGRIGIFEVLGVSDQIKQLALKRATTSQLTEQAKKEGFVDMKQDGILKALKGMTSIEEVWRVTKD